MPLCVATTGVCFLHICPGLHCRALDLIQFSRATMCPLSNTSSDRVYGLAAAADCFKYANEGVGYL